MNLHKNRDWQHVPERFTWNYIKTVIDNMVQEGIHEFTYKPWLTTCFGKVYPNLHKNRDWQHVPERFTWNYIKTVIDNMFRKDLHEFT